MLRSSYAKEFIYQGFHKTETSVNQGVHTPKGTYTKKLIYQGVQIPRSSYTSSYTKEFIHQGANKSKSSYTEYVLYCSKEFKDLRVNIPRSSYSITLKYQC